VAFFAAYSLAVQGLIQSAWLAEGITFETLLSVATLLFGASEVGAWPPSPPAASADACLLTPGLWLLLLAPSAGARCGGHLSGHPGCWRRRLRRRLLLLPRALPARGAAFVPPASFSRTRRRS
jgi:hypothetical protein